MGRAGEPGKHHVRQENEGLPGTAWYYETLFLLSVSYMCPKGGVPPTSLCSSEAARWSLPL